MHDSIVLGSQLPSGSRQRQWSNRCRPRERLLSGDATGLTDADLLAVCLGSGTSGQSGVALAEQLLERYGSVGAVLYAPVERLLSERGLGMAKVATLKAVLGKIRTEEVAVSVKHCAVGGINESDVALAEATKAIIVGFNVTSNAKARALAEAKGIEMRLYEALQEGAPSSREGAK